MNKPGSDTKVKKTLVRNFERKAKPLGRKQAVVLDMGCSSNVESSDRVLRSSQKENELNQPSICSSEALANYLIDVKKSLPLPASSETEKCNGANVTKKLNFHFNDKIYKNLIELNANVDDLKTKRDRKLVSSAGNAKRDLEPNIEDFCEEEKEFDLVPSIPVIKPKFKPIRKVENGQLHRLITSFEDL